ncbi:hypothetical protein TeGR_g6980 [Tetraparma gracilis]|uniref:Uncharacterized protein n=1 Tax=Tetraparma gracilis TaxID=2962635 RepID=A0ABQ6NA88_9STRA|nr:hypothetical protein TeGR_g6980 [Tetraparma gracilis]
MEATRRRLSSDATSSPHISLLRSSPALRPASSSSASPSQPSTTRHLKTLPLACLIYYSVSGGPFGMESSVMFAGAAYTLLGFVVFPVLWSVPEALITAELATAYPEASGCVAWVSEAFGPTAGLLNGYLTWLSGVTDNSLYPVLFLKYLVASPGEGAMPSWLDPGTYTRWLTIAGMVALLSYMNFRGLKLVGQVNTAIGVVSLLPFVALVALCIPHIDTSRWKVTPEGGFRDVQWSEFINILFWNLNYWDHAASFSGEVIDPGRTYPRASAFAVAFVTLGYVIPLLAIIGVSDSPNSDWTDGYAVVVARTVAGPWLSGWIVFASAISNLALFQAEMSSDSLQLMGMAERGLLPKVFGHKSLHGTPTFSILLSSAICATLAIFDFTSLVEMVNFLYVFSLFMEFAAFIALRINAADIDRPYMIPIGTVGCCIMLLPAVVFLVIMIVLASNITYCVCFGMVAVGALLYALMQYCRVQGLIEFQEGGVGAGGGGAVASEVGEVDEAEEGMLGSEEDDLLGVASDDAGGKRLRAKSDLP